MEGKNEASKVREERKRREEDKIAVTEESHCESSRIRYEREDHEVAV